MQQTQTAWPQKFDVLGVEVSATHYEEVVRLLIAAARKGEPAIATFLPVHGIVTGALDPAYRYRVNAFDLAAPDGQPVRWALNQLHHAGLADRVYGPTLMLKLIARAADERLPIYLYGSTPQVLDSLQLKLKQEFPALEIAGAESPPFRPLTQEENDAAVDRINTSGAKLLFIGLGLPRQDIFAHENRHKLKPVQLCVGAAFDFHAGNKKMAPPWMQKHGLEWLFRLTQEPGRLWKRYLVTNTVFLYLMAKRLLRGR